MRCLAAAALIVVWAGSILAADAPNPNTLTPQEIAEGWLLLFDGETTFGWKPQGGAKLADGALQIGGDKASTLQTTSQFASVRLSFEYQIPFEDVLLKEKAAVYVTTHVTACELLSTKKGQWNSVSIDVTPKAVRASLRYSKDRAPTTTEASFAEPTIGDAFIQFRVPAGCRLSVRDIKLQPLGLKPLFNAKDLTGWKEFPGKKSQFSVTKEGWLNVKNGPGDLQTTGQYDDFLLQLACISNGKHLNSGIFFRCIADQYQNGYEAQIQNGYKDGDRTKPADFGTGAIYRRVPARRVVPNDHEWFTMTVLAQGRHIATWVNGYQTVDWTDERPADDNPRKGSKTGKGHISIQGHDPTTDLSFRNLRIVELPRAEKK